MINIVSINIVSRRLSTQKDIFRQIRTKINQSTVIQKKVFNISFFSLFFFLSSYLQFSCTLTGHKSKSVSVHSPLNNVVSKYMIQLAGLTRYILVIRLWFVHPT